MIYTTMTSTDGNEEEIYKRETLRESIYKRTESYVGSDVRARQSEYLFSEGKMVLTDLDLPEAVKRVYLEILVNAADNVERTREAGGDIGTIIVDVTPQTITITNYGNPVPVRLHATEDMYVPELIFGNLLTSSNYENDKRDSKRDGKAGRNGLGAKLTNVFSMYFSIDLVDAERGLTYFQEWSDNMVNRSDPIIEKTEDTVSCTTITYTLDFERFESEEYSIDEMDIFHRYAAEVSYACRIPVIYNEIMMDYKNIKNFSSLYITDVDEASVTCNKKSAAKWAIHSRKRSICSIASRKQWYCSVQ